MIFFHKKFIILCGDITPILIKVGLKLTIKHMSKLISRDKKVNKNKEHQSSCLKWLDLQK